MPGALANVHDSPTLSRSRSLLSSHQKNRRIKSDPDHSFMQDCRSCRNRPWIHSSARVVFKISEIGCTVISQAAALLLRSASARRIATCIPAPDLKNLGILRLDSKQKWNCLADAQKD